ncbi:MAG TPA: hypothetical protein VHW44_23270 [Pseudonocardiaceae bacterium]|jgi:hypothetical protein|nr:hypothetical protein [Pseudonocardiaceae bacterium]
MSEPIETPETEAPQETEAPEVIAHSAESEELPGCVGYLPA